MYVPLWLVVTLVYVVVMALCLRGAARDTDFFGGFAELLGMGAATIAYLLFWVAYLALTR